MPFRFALFSLLVALCLEVAPESYAKTAAAPGRDAEYVSALAAANRFLHAWQAQDQESGLMLLSDEAKRKASEEGVENFFSPGADAAYEIARGRRLAAGRYAFPVVLIQATSERPRLRLRYTSIVIVRAGKDEWYVDRLP